MVVVSNSTALIPLGIVSYLNWLPNLFDRIVIPLEVYNEIVIQGDRKPGSSELKGIVNEKRVEVVAVQDVLGCRKLEKHYGLDRGEAEVLSLALELPADIVIIDEGKAWEIAKQFQDKFLTLCLPFVLDLAEQHGYIKSALNAFRTIRQTAKYSPAHFPFECWCKAHGFS